LLAFCRIGCASDEEYASASCAVLWSRPLNSEFFCDRGFFCAAGARLNQLTRMVVASLRVIVAGAADATGQLGRIGDAKESEVASHHGVSPAGAQR
jgi:hypothetical protein